MGYDLERFVVAQGAVWDRVQAELRQGRKVSHWMWFVFPQLTGLGRSEMAQRYAIESLEEARAYVVHPVLGVRLRACAHLLLAIHGRTAEEILGPIDAQKLCSSMTLFHRAEPGEAVFRQVLDRYCGGSPDPRTDELLT